METINKGAISNFIEKYYLHFNAAAIVDAAKEYEAQLAKGSKMLVSLAGAMSTAEIGKIFAEVIRQDKVVKVARKNCDKFITPTVRVSISGQFFK
mgnify:CR=1 FL=1